MIILAMPKPAIRRCASLVPQGMRIPEGKLAMGNPAKVVRDVSPELESYVTLGVEQYRELTRLYLRTMKEIPRG